MICFFRGLLRTFIYPVGCWVSGHNLVETFNDGFTQVLTCETCGFESKGKKEGFFREFTEKNEKNFHV